MSDKPVIQQQLSDTISALILRVPRESVMAFIATFWETMCAEWHGIDRLRYRTSPALRLLRLFPKCLSLQIFNLRLFFSRLDKFYFLLRRFLLYSFKMLKENQWDLETIEEFSTVMIDGPLK